MSPGQCPEPPSEHEPGGRSPLPRRLLTALSAGLAGSLLLAGVAYAALGHGGDAGPREPTEPLPHISVTVPQCDRAVAVGRAASCTAVVFDGSASNRVTPEGSVDWTSDGPGSFGGSCVLSPVATGRASCAISYTPSAAGSGRHVLTARFDGDGGEPPLEPSEESTEIVVFPPDPTATTVSCFPTALAPGAAANCTASVRDTAAQPLGSPLTGALGFTSSGPGSFSAPGCGLEPLANGRLGCRFQYTPSASGAGPHRITAAYSGDGEHTGSAGTASIAVPNTATSLLCAPADTTVGHASTCTVTVADRSATPSAPTGSVAFASDGQGEFPGGASCSLVGSGGASSSCQIAYTPTAVGGSLHRLTASYQGDGAHEPSRGTQLLRVLSGTVRFAAPGGTGTDPCADPADPCSLFTAADQSAPGTTIGAGDEVRLAPGAYAGSGDLGPSLSLSLPAGISLRGVPGRHRPVISQQGSSAEAAVVARADAIADLEIDSDGRRAILLEGDGTVVDGVVARTTANGAISCDQAGGGTIRDTVCLASGTEAVALGASVAADGTTTLATLRNVTALAAGFRSFGLDYELRGISEPPTMLVDALDVIARGRSKDVFAAGRGLSGTPGSGAVVEIALRNSDYVSQETAAADGGVAAVTPPGSGSNIVADPLLASDEFHERETSPTVDAGAADAQSGGADIDGQPRRNGPAPDIGADEFALHATTTTVECAPAAVAIAAGRSTTCTATVRDTSGDPTPPVNTVHFTSDGEGNFSGDPTCELGHPRGDDGVCEIRYTPTAAGSGSHRITAAFSGDPEHLGSEGAATVAVGRVRYAAPGASGPEPCVREEPCSLFTAASRFAPGTTIKAGDEVVLLLGRYSDVAGDLGSGFVDLPQGVLVHGEPGLPRPVIELKDETRSAPAIGVEPSDVVQHLRIESLVDDAGHSPDIESSGGTVEDVIAKSSSEGAIACSLIKGLIRDSACISSAPRGVALGVEAGGPARVAAQLRNVTAIADGAGSSGLGFTLRAPGDGSGSSAEVDGIGVIARGAAHDVAARGLALRPDLPGTGASVDIHLDHSDYATTFTETDEGGGSATVTEAGSGANIVAPPLLGIDRIHELPGSPTVDAGATDGLSGEFDIDGQARASGPAADIGADEVAGHPTATTVHCEPHSLGVEETATCTATVEDTSASPSVPGGSVEFASDSPGAIGAFCALGPGDAGRRSSCSVLYTPSGVGSGTHTIEADYSSDSSHQASAGQDRLAVSATPPGGPRPTTTTLICAPAPVEVGAPSHCTATVRNLAASGSSMPRGSVSFATAGSGSFSPSSCALGGSGLTAHCEVDYTPAAVETGSHRLTASYPGDSAHEPSSGQFSIAVEANGGGLHATSTTLACEPSSVEVGAPSHCTATVNDLAASGATPPGGSVSFETAGLGAFSAGQCTLAGAGTTASCAVDYIPHAVESGTQQLTAVYSGDASHELSTGHVGLGVGDGSGGGGGGRPHATVTRLTCEPAMVFLGGASVCTATIEDVARQDAGSPEGTVSFESDGPGGFSGQATCAAFPIDPTRSRCQLIYTPSALGGEPTHTIRATYEGDPSHEPSLGSAGVLVAPPNGGHRTATTVRCEPEGLSTRERARCTATVANTDGSAATPAGNVVFASDSPGTFAPGGCALADAGQGRAACAVEYAPLEGGEHELTAVYGGNNGNGPVEAHEPSLGTTRVGVTQLPHRTATDLVCSPTVAVLGADVTHCAAIVEDTEPNATRPTGTVRFQSDGKGSFSSSACDLQARGPARLAACEVVFTPEELRDQGLSATYQGDGGHEGSQATTQLRVLAKNPSPPPGGSAGGAGSTHPPVGAPDTAIRKKPRKRTGSRRARFRFVSDQPGSTFQCRLDRRPFRRCRSPFKRRVKAGRHVFRVRAVNVRGLVDPTPAVFKWRVGKARAAHRRR